MADDSKKSIPMPVKALEWIERNDVHTSDGPVPYQVLAADGTDWIVKLTVGNVNLLDEVASSFDVAVDLANRDWQRRLRSAAKVVANAIEPSASQDARPDVLEADFLDGASVDYRIAAFESQLSFETTDIQKAWQDGVRWGHNAAQYPGVVFSATRALQWSVVPDTGDEWFEARTPFGVYRADRVQTWDGPFAWRLFANAINGYLADIWPTLGDVQLAAQVDYEARIQASHRRPERKVRGSAALIRSGIQKTSRVELENLVERLLAENHFLKN